MLRPSATYVCVVLAVSIASFVSGFEPAVHINVGLPLFKVPITLDGVAVKLPVYKGDDFNEVAENFCVGHNIVTSDCVDAIEGEMWKLYSEEVEQRRVLTSLNVDVGGGIYRTLSFRLGDDPELAAKQFLFQQGMATTSVNARPIVQAIVAKVMTLSYYEPPSVPLFRRFIKLHMVPEYRQEEDKVVDNEFVEEEEDAEEDVKETEEEFVETVEQYEELEGATEDFEDTEAMWEDVQAFEPTMPTIGSNYADVNDVSTFESFSEPSLDMEFDEETVTEETFTEETFTGETVTESEWHVEEPFVPEAAPYSATIDTVMASFEQEVVQEEAAAHEGVVEQPETVYEQPEVVEQPEVLYEEPEALYEEPEVASQEPAVVEHAEVAYEEPEAVYEEPAVVEYAEVAYEEPEAVYEEPEAAYEEPEVAYQEPEIVEHAEVAYEQPEAVYETEVEMDVVEEPAEVEETFVPAATVPSNISTCFLSAAPEPQPVPSTIVTEEVVTMVVASAPEPELEAVSFDTPSYSNSSFEETVTAEFVDAQVTEPEAEVDAVPDATEFVAESDALPTVTFADESETELDEFDAEFETEEFDEFDAEFETEVVSVPAVDQDAKKDVEEISPIAAHCQQFSDADLCIQELQGEPDVRVSIFSSRVMAASDFSFASNPWEESITTPTADIEEQAVKEDETTPAVVEEKTVEVEQAAAVVTVEEETALTVVVEEAVEAVEVVEVEEAVVEEDMTATADDVFVFDADIETSSCSVAEDPDFSWQEALIDASLAITAVVWTCLAGFVLARTLRDTASLVVTTSPPASSKSDDISFITETEEETPAAPAAPAADTNPTAAVLGSVNVNTVSPVATVTLKPTLAADKPARSSNGDENPFRPVARENVAAAPLNFSAPNPMPKKLVLML